MRDPSKFRLHFKEYKEGKSIREIYGLPGYEPGKLPVEEMMPYILAVENPTKQGLVNGVWRPPTDSTKWDVHAIGGGLDIREQHNPIVYNYLKTNGRLGSPFLTAKEEEILREKVFKKTMLPALLNVYNKYGDKISPKGYTRLAGMKWQGHPFLMAISPDSVTGKAFIKAIESGDKDLDSVFDAYYKYPANAKRYAARILADTNYWKNHNTVATKPVPQEPIIARQDATRVALIPTAEQKVINYADRRNTFMAEAERQLEVKRDMLAINDMIFGQQPIYKSTYDIPIIELDQAEFKTTGHKDGKLPGYQKGLTPLQIEETIVKNQGTIQQGRRWSGASLARRLLRHNANDSELVRTLKSNGNYFYDLIAEGGPLDLVVPIIPIVRSAKNIAENHGDASDVINIGLGFASLGAEGKAVKDAVKRITKSPKPTKASTKKMLNAQEVSENLASKPKTRIDPKKYKQQTEYTLRITDQKTRKYNKTKLPSEETVLNSADFPENTNINALYGPEGMLFSNKIVNNDRLMDIAVPHEFKHYLQQYYNYTPELAMIMERAFPFSEKFIKEHPDFNFVNEGGAMLSELEYAIGKRYGFPVGKDFEDVVNRITPAEIEDMASKLSVYNRDASEQRIKYLGMPDVMPLTPEQAHFYNNFKDMLLKVPVVAGGATVVPKDKQYKNGKLPGYYEGELPMGEQRLLTDEEVKLAAQNASHEQGMSGEDPLMSMLVGMKVARLVGDLLAERRLKLKAEMYKRWREANELTRDASRAWKMLDADRMARNWGHSDNPLGFFYDIFLDPIANMYTKIQKHPILGPLIPFSDGKLPGYNNGKIRIKPANRGKFNATKKRTGKTTEELTHSKNPLTRKRAIFAQNARKWNHK